METYHSHALRKVLPCLLAAVNTYLIAHLCCVTQAAIPIRSHGSNVSALAVMHSRLHNCNVSHTEHFIKDCTAQGMSAVQSYQNLAARTDASLIWFAPEVTPVSTSTPALAPVSATANQTVPTDSPDGVDCHHQESMPQVTAGSDALLDSCDQGSNKRRKLTETEDTKEQLLDEDIDWTAPSTVAQDVVDRPDALGAAFACDGSEAIAQSKATQQKTLQKPQHIAAAVAGDREQPDSGSPPLSPDAKRVQNAVNEYIRAFLDPFYKAGIVTKEVGCRPLCNAMSAAQCCALLLVLVVQEPFQQTYQCSAMFICDAADV